MKIFVAGASGAVGHPLVRALCTLGHRRMTRAGLGVDRLRELGACASTVDTFDRQAVGDAITAATRCGDRPAYLAPRGSRRYHQVLPNDTRFHEKGGGNLSTAAQE